MNVDGTNQQRLTNTPGNELFPDLSPDMKKIAYVLVNFQTIKAEIHVMNADGTGDTLIARQGNITENAQWSPDGSKILFQTDRTGNFEIFVMNANGSNSRNLTNSTAYDYWPCWGKIKVSTNVKDNFGEVPKDFRLYQNYPNPFNPTTHIAFDIPSASRIELEVLNILGERIKTLVNEMKAPGSYSVTWDGKDNLGNPVSSGFYFYRLASSAFNQTRKAALVR